MQFRVATLNLEQDHKRWSDRHPLISAEIAALRAIRCVAPTMFQLIAHYPLQSATLQGLPCTPAPIR
jgi:hypothetical protein